MTASSLDLGWEPSTPFERMTRIRFSMRSASTATWIAHGSGQSSGSDIDCEVIDNASS